MSTNDEKEVARILPAVMAIKSQLVSDRRHFHSHPELAFEEFATSSFIESRLKKIPGISVESKVAPGTAVVATFSGTYPSSKSKKKTIGLRADMDALPIQEEGDLAFASTIPGVMHACGHDAHMAIMLGVVEILSKMRDKIDGNIKFIFQPAEENGNEANPRGGGYAMVHDSNVLQGVDEVYGLHVWSTVPVGVVGVSPGPIMAACVTFEIQVDGFGGHGAAPQDTVDVVVVIGHLINTLQTVVSRSHDPLQSAVLSIGSVQAGSAPNIIAGTGTMTGTVRTLSNESLRLTIDRMQKICKGTGDTFGAKVKFSYAVEAPNVTNTPNESSKVAQAASKIVGANKIQKFATMASEDFAYFLETSQDEEWAGLPITVRGKPGCFFFIGAASPNTKKDDVFPHHNSSFFIDEECLLVGCSVMVQLVQDMLCPDMPTAKL